jgi:hypothetical protein
MLAPTVLANPITLGVVMADAGEAVGTTHMVGKSEYDRKEVIVSSA